MTRALETPISRMRATTEATSVSFLPRSANRLTLSLSLSLRNNRCIPRGSFRRTLAPIFYSPSADFSRIIFFLLGTCRVSYSLSLSLACLSLVSPLLVAHETEHRASGRPLREPPAPLLVLSFSPPPMCTVITLLLSHHRPEPKGKSMKEKYGASPRKPAFMHTVRPSSVHFVTGDGRVSTSTTTVAAFGVEA